jgi:hypothetical protein
MMIAEPRVKRILYFFIYAGLAISGMGVFYKPPAAIVNLLGGMALVITFGLFIVVGALIALVAVLPGIWWLERAGLVSLAFGIAMYTVTLLFLGASFIVTILPIVIILICALRWLDIKEYLLAPREG